MMMKALHFAPAGPCTVELSLARLGRAMTSLGGPVFWRDPSRDCEGRGRGEPCELRTCDAFSGKFICMGASS